MGSPENKDEAPQDAEDPPKVVGVNIDEKQNTLGRYAMDDDSDETDDELQPPDDYGGVALGAHQKRAKREKRLAMNRASARERRRRKRILLNKLEEKVLELTKKIQTLQDVNDGLQVHVRKLEGDVAKSHTVIASLSSGATRGRPSPATSSLQSMDPGLRSLLLGGRPSSFPTELGAGATGGFSGILAERQILLDLQAHQRHRNMLQANAGIAGPGALGAGRPIPGTGPTHPLFGRMNYLNALTENTLASRHQRGLRWEGESKVDAAMAFSRGGGGLMGRDTMLPASEEKETLTRQVGKRTSPAGAARSTSTKRHRAEAA